MPDEEPHVLLEMEEKFSAMLGIPRSFKKREPSNLTIEDVENHLMKNKLIEQDFRYLLVFGVLMHYDCFL